MNVRAYALVTSAYWAFTLTDGALRMMVLLYFHDLGYSPVSLSLLFVLYELLGVFTNLVGGWAGARYGLHRTLAAGLMLQVCALVLLSFHSPSWREWLAVAWVMSAQALSGIAKDLTKMSSKTALKFVVSESKLFTWVALLTGSKNALKGVGFFLGAALLGWRGFDQSLLIMAVALAAILVVVLIAVRPVGMSTSTPPLKKVVQKSPAVARLSLARFFLFGSRDVWFVVALPVFLTESLGWPFEAVGAFLAFWVIGYGVVQALAPRLMGGLRQSHHGATTFLSPLIGIAVLVAVAVYFRELQAVVTIGGLLVFGVLFALTSSVHSYLILAYSAGDDDTALDVGFYYSANAAGRLVGTLLSGILYLVGGLVAALIGTAVMLTAALAVSVGLPQVPRPQTQTVAT